MVTHDSMIRGFVSELEDCLARGDSRRAQEIRGELRRAGYRGRDRGQERAVPAALHREVR